MADPGFPCYTHPSLGSLLSSNNISWTYYGDDAHNFKAGTDLWTAISTARHSTAVTHSAVAAWFTNWPRNPVGRGNTRCCTLSPATTAPDANLTLDGKSNIYGTTATGGAAGAGVVFEITP
jgi:uncharacterized repeat protein (TIGR03803 family)